MPSPPVALSITMIEAAFVGSAVPSPRGTIRPAPGGPPAQWTAVHLPAIASRTDDEKRVAQRTGGKPEVEHVLACADLLPRSSSRARLHPSMRPRSTWKAGSCRSRPSSYRRSSVVPNPIAVTKFPAAGPLGADHSDRSGQSQATARLALAEATSEESRASVANITSNQVMMHAYDALGKLGGTGTTFLLGDYSKLPNWLFPRMSGFQSAPMLMMPSVGVDPGVKPTAYHPRLTLGTGA